MNRFDRIVAILIQLQSKRIIKAQDIADRFDVSLRTVYRDIRSLEEAGVPISGEAGVGYSIMSSYRLPPIMFTEEEAISFLLAEKFIEKMTDEKTKELYKSALFKIKAVLRSNEKDTLENLDKHIEISKQYTTQDSNTYSPSLQTIFRSISNKNILDVQYTAINKKKSTQRLIEPVGIYYYTENWHLIAYCRLRKAYRDFRIDRFQKVKLTNQYFDANHPTIKDYLNELANKVSLEKVVIQFKKETALFARTQKYFYGFIDEKTIGDKVEMSFLSPSLKGMARWLLIFTSGIDIISPPSLKVEMEKLTKELMDKY